MHFLQLVARGEVRQQERIHARVARDSKGQDKTLDVVSTASGAGAGWGSWRVASGVPHTGQVVSPGRTASQRGHQLVIATACARGP